MFAFITCISCFTYDFAAVYDRMRSLAPPLGSPFWDNYDHMRPSLLRVRIVTFLNRPLNDFLLWLSTMGALAFSVAS